MKEAILGIDIGGTSTKYGLIDANNKIIFSGQIPTKGHYSLESYLDCLSKEIISSLAGTPYEITGIGVGAPKGNCKTGYIEEAYNLMTWGDNLPITELLRDVFNTPTFLLNDSNAAAIGEKYFGLARGYEDFIVLTLGTGVGGGVFVANKLLVGAKGAAGEIGHTTIERDGRLCSCGRYGCLEAYAAAPGIVRTMRDVLAWKSGEIENPEDYERCDFIAEQAQRGDELAIKAFEYTGKKLGMSLADQAAIFDPQAIILAGGVARAGEVLLEPVRTYFNTYAMDIYKHNVQIDVSYNETRNMAVLGAAAYARENLSQESYNVALRV